MKALRFDNGELRLAEIPLPEARGEAIVKVHLAGICNTDLEILRGYSGFSGTLGHEFIGVVSEAPDREWVGRRVVGEINAGCGLCALCVSGDPRHCSGRTVLGIVNRDGAFAEYLRLPFKNLHPVPDGISDEVGVFTEPLAAACGIVDLIDIGEKTRTAVVGDGKLGNLCAQALRVLTGAKPLVVGKHETKLGLLRRLGFEVTLSRDIPPAMMRSFDVVVEASGNAAGFDLALDMVRPRGDIVLKSTFQGAIELNSARIVVDEISIVGSRCGRFRPALELLAGNEIDVKHLIRDVFPLENGVAAMARARQPGVLKVLLKPR